MHRRTVLLALAGLGACKGEPVDEAKVFGAPYTEHEIAVAQQRYQLQFPPDLIELCRRGRLRDGYDWTRDHAAIREALNWPYGGLLFDVENNGLWWPEWGRRPGSEAVRAEVLKRVVDAAPRLIPLAGHRYLPASPGSRGNPVFSVYQADVIYYGADLANWIDREFGPPRPGARLPHRPRWIPFWSELVERMGENSRPA